QAIQLPFFFKLGYAKAKFFTFVPFVALTSGYVVILGAANNLKHSAIYESFVAVAETIGKNGILLAAISIAALAIVIFASYRLSLAFYKKREF
ncbi:MAG: ABC-2 transporter permease, partial [Clostridiales bacterium]|nr:ABC-2 transporter permease [Clostridiales bacterium]